MDGVQFPVVGNSIIMALVILTHVFLAFFAVGGLALAVAAEWRAARRKDDDYLRLAKDISGFLSDMMKVNGVLGAGIVVLTIGLWSPFGAFLYSTQFWPFLAEGGAFLLLMIFSIAYHNTWDHASRGRHLFFGMGAAGFALLAGFLINGIWSFMMVPGRWIQTRSRWDAFFTPILPASTLHLLLPCLINAALLVFLWTLWKSRKTNGAEQAYYGKMSAFAGKSGAVLLFFQPLSGLSFLLKVKSATEELPAPNPWRQIAGGMAHSFLIAMIALAVIAVVGAGLYLAMGHDKGRRALVAAALAMFLAFFMGAFTRERARKPYLVWNTMALNQQLVSLGKPAGIEPAVQDTTALNGEQVFKRSQCRSCHTFKGAGGSFGPDLSNVKSILDRTTLMDFVRQPPEPASLDMPPFTGSDEELGALADYLLQ